jgi:dTDP-4-amino-4,6-dideoxygalactose transaminase
VAEGALPEAERAAREVVSLPLFVGITGEQLDAVCAAANEECAPRAARRAA